MLLSTCVLPASDSPELPAADLVEALYTHGLLLFRNQEHVTPADEVRLAQLGDGAAPATDGHVLRDECVWRVQRRVGSLPLAELGESVTDTFESARPDDAPTADVSSCDEAVRRAFWRTARNS